MKTMDKPGLKIRRMTVLDVEAVAGIEKECFASPWSEADFRYEMTENPVARYLVALDGETPVGFAGAHIILGEGHITNVALLAPYRGQGQGRALAQALMQYAANLLCGYLTLEVRQSNNAAIELYRSLGFQKVSVRKKYYENGEDAWLMVCDKLPEPEADFTEASSAVLPQDAAD